jgi:hypothetical protein
LKLFSCFCRNWLGWWSVQSNDGISRRVSHKGRWMIQDSTYSQKRV